MHSDFLFLTLTLGVWIAAIPPLTAEQRTQLETAYDGRDHEESAFAALVEHAQTWSPGAADSFLRLDPDLDAMIAEPDRYRGDLCRLTGAIQQQRTLPRPWNAVTEWFVRMDDGTPAIVFVVGHEETPAPNFRDGARVKLEARFYKRIDAIARDGKTHQYAAFVGTNPRHLPLIAGDPINVPFVIVMFTLVGGLLIVFIPLLVWARRRRATTSVHTPLRGFVSNPITEGVDADDALPDDPADALDELRQRARAGEP